MLDDDFYNVHDIWEAAYKCKYLVVANLNITFLITIPKLQ